MTHVPPSGHGPPGPAPTDVRECLEEIVLGELAVGLGQRVAELERRHGLRVDAERAGASPDACRDLLRLAIDFDRHSFAALLVVLPTSRAPRRSARVLAVPEGGEVAVGADPSNDLVIDDRYLDDRHAVLSRRSDVRLDRPATEIEDLGSTNGTFVDSVLALPDLGGHGDSAHPRLEARVAVPVAHMGRAFAGGSPARPTEMLHYDTLDALGTAVSRRIALSAGGGAGGGVAFERLGRALDWLYQSGQTQEALYVPDGAQAELLAALCLPSYRAGDFMLNTPMTVVCELLGWDRSRAYRLMDRLAGKLRVAGGDATDLAFCAWDRFVKGRFVGSPLEGGIPFEEMDARMRERDGDSAGV